MDDIKIIFWIVLGLIYLFARKKKAAPQPSPRREVETDQEYSDPASPGPKSFEEILREIQEMKSPPPEPAPVARPTASREVEVVDYDDNLEEEDKGLEEKRYDYQKEDKVNQIYEDARSHAFERPSLEESVKLEDTIVRFKQFEGYEKGVRINRAEGFMKDLKDPQGFRKAFLMSEILRRKF